MHQDRIQRDHSHDQEVTQQANPEITQQGEAMLEDLSALDAMIDSVLEEDAAQFVEQFRQKGGQ